jgi:hypothetical protein
MPERTKSSPQAASSGSVAPLVERRRAAGILSSAKRSLSRRFVRNYGRGRGAFAQGSAFDSEIAAPMAKRAAGAQALRVEI